MKNLKEIELKISESIENLRNELKNGKSERFIEYLNFCAKFYNYSLNNKILLFGQMPNASKVAGFKSWEKLGFNVNKGSNALRILAPQSYKYIDVDGKKIFFNQMTQEQKNNKELHKEGIIYKSVPVFDISQCSKKDKNIVSEFFYKLGDSEKESYLKVKKKIENLGIEVIETNDTNGAEGVSLGGTILIKESLDYNNKLLTIIHELAHEMLDKGLESDREDTTIEIRELRAESVSYIVGKYISLDNPFSSDYILSFKGNVDSLNEHLEKINSTSNKIINTLFENK